MTLNEPSGKASDREITNSRVFNAPRETVFAAFSNPDRLAVWWGPKGFTNTFHKFDFRPGGEWLFDMVGPDGARYALVKRIEEVAEPARVVLRQVSPMHQFLMTMTYVDEGGKTRLTWRMEFDSPEELAAIKDMIAVANEENFDRLETFLAKDINPPQ